MESEGATDELCSVLEKFGENWRGCGGSTGVLAAVLRRVGEVREINRERKREKKERKRTEKKRRREEKRREHEKESKKRKPKCMTHTKEKERQTSEKKERETKEGSFLCSLFVFF